MPSPRGEETGPKRETTGQASSEPGTHQPPVPPQPHPSENHPPPPHPPGNHPPPYPPVMGYPGYPNPYPNYQNGPYNNQYGPYATQAPPANYYGSSPYPTQQYPAHQATAASAGFFRGIISGLMFLVILLCLSTLITWLVLRPQIPVFFVTHFAVTGFNVTRPIFAAEWTANLTVENPNSKLQAYFDRIQGFIYHQNSDGEDEFLATAFFPPVYVETKKTAEIGESMTAGEKAEEPVVPLWVAEEMKKERESGTVAFSLRMVVWVTFKTEGWGSRQRRLKVFCEKLKVGFDGGSGNGAVSLPKPLPCLVYI